MRVAALVEMVKAHAVGDGYAKGWDVVAECWGDEEIAEAISGCRAWSGAWRRVQTAVAPYNEQRDAVRAEFDEPRRRRSVAAAASSPTVSSVSITPRSLELFLAFARDAGNWSGTPLVGGNVGGSRQDRGNLTQLKRAGLIETSDDGEGCIWLSFTPAGVALAAEHDVEVVS